jgi:serine/threonine-protein kinase
MKRNTPLITLLTGAALGVILLIASMLATPSKAPTGYAAATTPTLASTAAIVPSSPAAPSPASPAPTATAYANAPARADYAGRVHGGGASVAISIHGSQVIAYVCNGSVIEAWLKGTAAGGRLVMTGKNQARLSATYDSKRAAGDVVARGTHYSFSVHPVRKPSGLYEATAAVRGATIKAGWIVLPDGTQVGSLESNADAAAPSAAKAPVLDVATGTAQDGSTVLQATPVSGVTGSGF